jgi:hypothetical protein
MSKVKRIEREVEELSTAELTEFREWFLEFDWQVWDRQIERDAEAGKLDSLAEEALREHAAGKTKPI